MWRYQIDLPGTETPIVLEYHKEEFPVMECAICRYVTHRISILLTDGIAAVMKDNILYYTVRGDVLLFRPEEIHWGRILRPGQHEYLDILVPTDYFKGLSPACCGFLKVFETRGQERINHLNPAIDRRMEILNLAEKLRDAVLDAAPEKAMLTLAWVIEMLELCGALCQEQERLSPSSGEMPAAVRKAMDFISRNYAQEIGLHEIAQYAGCSVSYLTRCFRRYTGRTVCGYLMDYRLLVATKLLEEGQNVTETAYRTGFADASSFIKCFKKQFQITPHKYRLRRETPPL